jgi:hypothetical protein
MEVMLLPDNKANGAVGIRFDCGASSMAFVCSQLRSGDGMGACAERNRQFKRIADDMFRDVVSGYKTWSNPSADFLKMADSVNYSYTIFPWLQIITCML